MGEVMVRANGVDLCVETFGVPGGEPVLLIGGSGASMDWWEVGFCLRLAEGGRAVVRYDHRDTGRSTSYPPGAPGYSGEDLAEDAAALIAAVGGGRAHVVGISMGGGIAQELAIRYPDRVRTVTLMSTTSIAPEEELPGMAPELAAAFAEPAPDPDWGDEDAVVELLVEDQRSCAGPGNFDESTVRDLARQVVRRTVDIESSVRNHLLLHGTDGPTPRLGDLTAPALIVHGTHDPLFPAEHAHALARQLPGAEVLLLPGVGHQSPPAGTWDLVVGAVRRLWAAGQIRVQ